MLLFFTHCFHLEGIADINLLYFMISICMPNSLTRSSLERINPLNFITSFDVMKFNVLFVKLCKGSKNALSTPCKDYYKKFVYKI